jgi:hypothetical protein
MVMLGSPQETFPFSIFFFSGFCLVVLSFVHTRRISCAIVFVDTVRSIVWRRRVPVYKYRHMLCQVGENNLSTSDSVCSLLLVVLLQTL